jgi:hypothetical protein
MRVNKPVRSRAALEFLCETVLREVPGWDAVSVCAIERTEAGRNWDVAIIASDKALEAEYRQRAVAALTPWMDRFDLAWH